MPNGDVLRVGENVYIIFRQSYILDSASVSKLQGIHKLSADGSRKIYTENYDGDFLSSDGKLASSIIAILPFGPEKSSATKEVRLKGKVIRVGDILKIVDFSILREFNEPIQALTPLMRGRCLAQVNGSWHIIVYSGRLLENITHTPQ